MTAVKELRGKYPEASARFPDDREFLFQMMPVIRFENFNWNPLRGIWYS